MRSNFTITELGLILMTFGHDFKVRINKCGNIELSSPNRIEKYIFYGYPAGNFMIRRIQPNKRWVTAMYSSIWPLGRNSHTNEYKYFDSVSDMCSWFCGYIAKNYEE